MTQTILHGQESFTHGSSLRCRMHVDAIRLLQVRIGYLICHNAFFVQHACLMNPNTSAIY